MNEAQIESARQLIDLAFTEDLGEGQDVTSHYIVAGDRTGAAHITARESGVVCGTPLIPLVIERFSADIQYEVLIPDSSPVHSGQVCVNLQGNAIDLLKTERTILNFMGRLSGIASLTQQFVSRVHGNVGRIFDTRKTTPGWRELEKYAVRCGGGENHRMGLFDAMLVKDNHLAVAGHDRQNWVEVLRDSMERFRSDHADKWIEVEVDSIEQFEKVMPLRPDMILLDNMSNEQLMLAVQLREDQPVQLEASGGVRLDTVAGIANTGVDRISVGGLTHSAVQFDWGLDWDT